MGWPLALFPLADLGTGTGHPATFGTPLPLAQNLSSPAEVDAAVQRARAAGARILKEPQRAAFGGYHGYFADPDGHRWEVCPLARRVHQQAPPERGRPLPPPVPGRHAGSAGGRTQFEPVLEKIRVPRTGLGSPHKKPDSLAAVKAYRGSAGALPLRLQSAR